MRRYKLWITAAMLAIPALLTSGCNMGQYEEPRYTQAQPETDGIEIRNYESRIVAQVRVSGEREEAINQGFRLIADYIFGNNTPKASISMTTPVIQQAASGKEIAMTTPVIQQGAGKPNAWMVQFVMPSEYTLKTLPKPNNPNVKLRQLSPKKMAVIRFSGSSSAENLAEHQDRLTAYIKERKLKTVGAPVLAFYDPPWTLPMFRRNEIMLELAK